MREVERVRGGERERWRVSEVERGRGGERGTGGCNIRNVAMT